MSDTTTEPGIPVRRLLISIFLVMVSVLPAFLVGAAFLQLEKDIGLTPTGLGALTAVFFIAAAISSAPLGRVVQRIGWRRSMQINVVVSGVVLLLIAAFGDRIWVMATLLVVGGSLYGLANPAANQSLAEKAATGRRGLVFGLKHAGIPASSLFAGAAVPLLILTIGWRSTFAMAALLAPVVWLLIADETDATPDCGRPRQSAKTPLGSKRLIVLAVASTLAAWAAVSLGIFLVAASVEAGLSESQGGLLLFGGSVASLVARVVAGVIVDRRAGNGFIGVSLMMTAGAGAFALISATAGMTFALAVVLGFTFGWGWPGLLTYSVVESDPEAAAATSSITQSGIFLGAGIGPITLGWIIETWSYRTGWLLITGFLVVAAAIVYSVARQVPSVTPTH